MESGVVQYSTEDFYHLCRTVMVKDEKHLDLFDVLFGQYFKAINTFNLPTNLLIPPDWLAKNKHLHLTDDEKALIQALGGWDKLLERFNELLNTQKERHEGGNQQIGTAGTSPFGAYGYNPQGYRKGQETGNNKSAIKVWDKRDFKNLDDKTELNTRNLKMALRQLRLFTRQGLPDELNIDGTIKQTAHNGGLLQLEMMPSKQNRVKVLLFLDVGGSMDEYAHLCAQLFTAAKYEFKHLEYFYFHNCLYEYVWKDNTRRHQERIPTTEILHRYNHDYKVIVVGDAYMSPYEITHPAGSVEHYNPEAGSVWLQRLTAQYPYFVWLNPTAVHYWQLAPSINLVRQLFQNRMFPLTVNGISQAMKALKNNRLTFDP